MKMTQLFLSLTSKLILHSLTLSATSNIAINNNQNLYYYLQLKIFYPEVCEISIVRLELKFLNFLGMK